MIEIDASIGGGQILRTALSLAAITGKEVKLYNIRKNRPNPGLRWQHYTLAKAVRSISRGELKTELYSQELYFKPGNIIGGRYEFKIPTAGSSILLIQTILPILLFANKESEIIVEGGTHNPLAPTFDYFAEVFLPAIRRMNASVEAKLIEAGYYPEGGGKIFLKVSPSQLRGNKEWNWEEEKAIIAISNLPQHIAQREKRYIINKLGIENIFVREYKSRGKGNAVLIHHGFIGAQAIGMKGKRAENVAMEAIEEFQRNLNYGVDRHLADQLLLYAFLAEGKTTFSTPEFTDHFLSNLKIIELFIERKYQMKRNLFSVLP